MNRMLLRSFVPFAIVLLVIASACKSTGYGYAVKDEETTIEIAEEPNAINYAALKKQEIPTLADRAVKSRGLPFLGGAVSLATNAVKKMIDNDRKKYTAEYSFALTDLYFYDQLSTESAFDPVGMQFSGFTLIRTFVNKAGITDTALIAHFALDTAQPNEIINNSVFRLKLTSLTLNYTKAKLTSGQKKGVNMDIEIIFNTSYVNALGQLFDNVELGKFYLSLRNAPLDKNSPGYKEYYDDLKGKALDGKSFIVPRSFGYYLASPNNAVKSFSQGAYSINVNVVESTKDKFITKVLADNSGNLIDVIGDKTKKLLDK